MSQAKFNINITNHKLETLKSLLWECKCSVDETARENSVHLFILAYHSYFGLK